MSATSSICTGNEYLQSLKECFDTSDENLDRLDQTGQRDVQLSQDEFQIRDEVGNKATKDSGDVLLDAVSQDFCAPPFANSQ